MKNHRLSVIIPRFLIVILISGSTLSLMATLAQACKCGNPRPTRQAVKESAMVFRGKVLTMETFQNGDGDSLRVKFVLKRLWKGQEQPYVTVITGLGDGDCGYPFVKGKEYLVYAVGTGQKLATGSCDRTKSWLTVSPQEIQKLGKGKDIAWD